MPFDYSLNAFYFSMSNMHSSYIQLYILCWIKHPWDPWYFIKVFFFLNSLKTLLPFCKDGATVFLTGLMLLVCLCLSRSLWLNCSRFDQESFLFWWTHKCTCKYHWGKSGDTAFLFSLFKCFSHLDLFVYRN